MLGGGAALRVAVRAAVVAPAQRLKSIIVYIRARF
jgi:hypothetical protein